MLDKNHHVVSTVFEPEVIKDTKEADISNAAKV